MASFIHDVCDSVKSGKIRTQREACMNLGIKSNLVHWSTGAEDVTINGKAIKGDKRRAGSVHANAAMWVDPHLEEHLHD
jgi:hypothetical protein